MNHLQDLIEVAERCPGQLTLATVVATEGHAYRKKGAAMLFTEEGKVYGHISPGCIENDLQERLTEVWNQVSPLLVVYDMRPVDDEWSWGSVIGCGGSMHILLEPLTNERRKELSNLRTDLEKGKSVTRCYQIEGSEIKLDYRPKSRLVLWGGGPDARPLASLAAQAGFRVWVTDWREEYLSRHWFPQAEQLITGSPKDVLPLISLSEEDFVLLLSHSFPRDLEFLQFSANRRVGYLGLLGSKERSERLLHGLSIQSPLSYPAGLAIGAEGADEIAVSIVAELISHRKGREKRDSSLYSVVYGSR